MFITCFIAKYTKYENTATRLTRIDGLINLFKLGYVKKSVQPNDCDDCVNDSIIIIYSK